MSKSPGRPSCPNDVLTNIQNSEDGNLSFIHTQQIPLENFNAQIVFADDGILDNIPIDPLFEEANKPTPQIPSDVNKVRTHGPSDVEDEPTAKKTKYRNTLNINQKEILDEHPLGPSILAIYKHTQELDTQCQSYVCDIVVLHFLKSGSS